MRRRCVALEAENTALRQTLMTPVSEPKLLPPGSIGNTERDLLGHLAAQLDEHATFGNALKARLEWVAALSKGLHGWTRDVLNPFNRGVENRLRFLEMLVEETILASAPDLRSKLARIREIVGSADLSADVFAPPPRPADNAVQDGGKDRR